MNIKYAYLCVECEEVNDRAPSGVCQVCGSVAVYPLSRAVSARTSLGLKDRIELSPLAVWDLITEEESK